MADVELTCLLMGKTGHGNSETGNSLLGNKAFITSSNTTPETKEVMQGFAEFDNYRLTVVDGPGLEDTDMEKVADRETAIANMTNALILCNGVVDAFLFVIKFGSRFTEKEKSALEALKQILGTNYMKHVIVVVTYGDFFVMAMEKEDCENTFDEWCRKQSGAFRQLYDDCKGRVVLVNNFETDGKLKHAQRNKILQFTVDLKNLNGRYTCPPLSLTFLLFGKSGHGKSKTGNTLLGRDKAFKASASATSETKEVMQGFAEFDNYVLTVVDGPGLEDTDMEKVADKETAIGNMTNALGECDGGVEAFLFVTRFGCRFTEEERSALEALKRILGTDYMKHVIVVVTGGDSFKQEMKGEGEYNITFDEWCRKQRGAFRQLYDDCNGRVVLVNNFEKDEKLKHAQRHEIIQLTVKLKTINGRYTSESFQAAKAERDKMIVELKAPELGKQFQAKASLLAARIEQLRGEPSNSERDEIFKRIQDLRDEINKNDIGTGVLHNWMNDAERLQRTLHNVMELQRLAEELETIRHADMRFFKFGN